MSSPRISRTQLQLEVRYSAPAFDCRRILRVLPLRRSYQTVRCERIRVAPKPDWSEETLDRFGNRRLYFFHRKLNEFRLDLELETIIDERISFVDETRIGIWKMPSRATIFAPEFRGIAREAHALLPLERAAFLCELCFDSLQYTSQTNDSPPEASAIWNGKRGNCADFTHVFLCLCRMSGLPARYVAGFNPAHGQMHAWAEAFVDKSWRAFDPTHGRAPSPGTVAVATGRDFYDTAPVHGTFRGDATAQLSLFCRTETRPF